MYKVALLSQQREADYLCLKLKSCKRAISLTNSPVTVVVTLYSDSANDLATTYCFLHFHEIKESPKKTQKLEMNLLILGQPAQSAPQQDFRCKVDCAEKKRPYPGLFL